VNGVLTSIFHPGADARAVWVLTRDAAIERLVTLVLEKLSLYGASETKLAEAQEVLEDASQVLAAGGPWSWEDLTAKLEGALN
jgi:hypothetical protein